MGISCVALHFYVGICVAACDGASKELLKGQSLEFVTKEIA